MLGVRQLDDLPLVAMSGGRSCWLRAGVGLIDLRQGHGAPVVCPMVAAICSICARSCSLASVTTKASNSPSVSTARRTVLPLASFGPIRARASAALEYRLPGAAIQNRGARQRRAVSSEPQHGTQIPHDRVKRASGDSAFGVLGGDFSSREVMRQQAPSGSGSHQPAQRIEHFTQIMRALRGIGRHQGQMRHDERPFVVADV